MQSADDDGEGTEGWIKSKQGSERGGEKELRGATQMIEKYEESEGERGGNRFQRRKKEKVHRRASKEACNTLRRFLERKSRVKDEDT